MVKQRKRTAELFIFLLLTFPFHFHYLFNYLTGRMEYSDMLVFAYAGCLGLLLYLPALFMRSFFVYIVIYFIQAFLSFSEYFYTSLYHASISRSTLYILFETNFSEAYEYISTYLSFDGLSLIYLSILFIPWLILVKNIQKVQLRFINKYYLASLFFLAAIPFSPLTNGEVTEIVKQNIFVRLYKAYNEYDVELEKQKAMAAVNMDKIEDVKIDNPYGEEEAHILVIGESTSRHHMSLYNYVRETNPLLGKIKKELFVFRDAVSPHSHTIPSLIKMLTFKHDEKSEDYLSKGSLIHYMKKAGYYTYWISNQVPVGVDENLITVLAKASDHTIFTNLNSSWGDPSLDEKVLIPLMNALDSREKKKFIIIHLMGSHIDYCKRYPDEYALFAGIMYGKNERESAVINCYDNAILYNDYILYRMIEEVKKKNIYSTLLYFSDHGEDVYDTGDFSGHAETQGTKYMFDVPLILWASKKYRDFNSHRIENFHKYVDRKYLLNDFIFSVMDLINIDFKSFDSTKSIFNKDFKFKKRMIGDTDYDKSISRVISLIDFKKDIFNRQSVEFKEKVWAHRVNSTEKLKEAVAIFKGIELDVVYKGEENIFDVNHPPAKSAGLTLETYMESIDNPGDYYFWLDMKNLNDKNNKAVLKKLVFISERFKLQEDNIVVESHNPLLLIPFKEAGFFTSYYLNSKMIAEARNKGYENLSEEDLAQIHNMNELIQVSNVDGLSTYSDYYDFIERFFPTAKNILLWHPALEHHKSKDRRGIYNILNKSKKIKVLLIKFKSDYYI